ICIALACANLARLETGSRCVREEERVCVCLFVCVHLIPSWTVCHFIRHTSYVTPTSRFVQIPSHSCCVQIPSHSCFGQILCHSHSHSHSPDSVTVLFHQSS